MNKPLDRRLHLADIPGRDVGGFRESLLGNRASRSSSIGGSSRDWNPCHGHRSSQFLHHLHRNFRLRRYFRLGHSLQDLTLHNEL